MEGKSVAAKTQLSFLLNPLKLAHLPPNSLAYLCLVCCRMQPRAKSGLLLVQITEGTVSDLRSDGRFVSRHVIGSPPIWMDS